MEYALKSSNPLSCIIMAWSQQVGKGACVVLGGDGNRSLCSWWLFDTEDQALA